jgi:hypothetical protein
MEERNEDERFETLPSFFIRKWQFNIINYAKIAWTKKQVGEPPKR